MKNHPSVTNDDLLAMRRLIEANKALPKDHADYNEVKRGIRTTVNRIRRRLKSVGTEFEVEVVGQFNRKPLAVFHTSTTSLVDAAIAAKNGYIKTIQNYRRIQKAQGTTISSRQRRMPSGFLASYNPSNFANGVPGTFLSLLEAKKVWIETSGLSLGKSPSTPENHVGIELEFYALHAGHRELSKDLVDTGFGRFLTMKGDGSLTAPPSYDYEGRELCICAPSGMMDTIVRSVTEVLAKHKCKVNKTCGTHIHLDARNASPVTVFNNLKAIQNIIFQMQPESRQNNRYCKRTRSQYGEQTDRYYGINGRAYRSHRTIEVRAHAGTIDADKIINFVKLCQFVAYSPEATIAKKRLTCGGSLRKLGLESRVCDYVDQRIAQFKSA